MIQTKGQKSPGKVRATIITWLGGNVGLDEAAMNAITAMNSDSGAVVSESAMLSLSAVWACTRIISETISTLPLQLFQKTPSGRIAATMHPLYNIIHARPNADATAAVHWEATTAAMILRGNGRAEKLMIDGRIVGLKFLPPCQLTMQKLANGKYNYIFTEDGKQRVIPEDRIFNIPGFSLDGKNGTSVVCHSANVMGAALSAERAANATFKNGMMPTTAFKFPTLLQDKQREDAKTAIATISGALNAGRPAIFEAGMDAMKIGIDPKDAQLLESRAWSVEEICRWFRVDPSMVGHGGKDSNFGTGLEQKTLGFLMFTIRPWLTRIEQAINKDLLTPAEQLRYYAEFNVDGLLRGDSAARSNFYASALQNGYMNRNQVAAKENMPPIPGGDIYTVQSNLIPLDQLGKTTP